MLAQSGLMVGQSCHTHLFQPTMSKNFHHDLPCFSQTTVISCKQFSNYCWLKWAKYGDYILCMFTCGRFAGISCDCHSSQWILQKSTPILQIPFRCLERIFSHRNFCKKSGVNLPLLFTLPSGFQAFCFVLVTEKLKAD